MKRSLRLGPPKVRLDTISGRWSLPESASRDMGLHGGPPIVVEKQRIQVRGCRRGQQTFISPQNTAAKVAKLKAVTVERGATPAEAATAASLSRRLVRRSGRQRPRSARPPATRPSVLAPGVHVVIQS
jgi:hypothetical protein